MLALYLLIFGCRSNVKLIEWNEEALQKSQQEDEVDTIVKLKHNKYNLSRFGVKVHVYVARAPVPHHLSRRSFCHL